MIFTEVFYKNKARWAECDIMSHSDLTQINLTERAGKNIRK